MEPTQSRPSRRTFLGQAGATLGTVTVLGTAGGIFAPRAAAEPAAGDPPEESPVADWFPRQDPEVVQRVVGASHGDIDTVRELVTKRPALAKAEWDWGYGDWESALGAASHTGRREIAEILLAHGARPTLFSAAMLGQLGVVRAFVETSPGIQATPGPHGIPLLAHARAGGEAAAPVLAYLERVGGADGGPPAAPLADAERDRYIGTYRFGAGTLDAFEVAVGRFGLTIARREGTPRTLTHLGDHAFHPSGAPAVRIRFEVVAGEAVAVTVHDPEPVVTARRVVER